MKHLKKELENVINHVKKSRIKPEKYTPNESLQKAYIFDIDGTLALMGNRSPYEWDRVDEDTVNEPVARVLRGMNCNNMSVIICTGRDGVCEPKTRGWLCDNNMDFQDLYMRKTGDNRKDSIVKKEMFNEIKKKYHVLGVFDDRNQTVKMWRDMGLTCFQVAEGNF